jgi:sec-independent protein translocase protein TatC
MPLVEHLEELRSRLFKMLGALAGGFVVGYIVARPVLRYILQITDIHHVIVVDVAEAFFAVLKIAFVVGLVVASPVIFYQVAAFVVPGLLPRERRLLGVVLAPGLLLFLAGMAAGFYWVVPPVLRIMLSFAGPGITPDLRLASLVAFVIGLTVPLGFVAEMPLVAGVLANLGILSPQWFARQRRYALLLAFVVAAIITPPNTALAMVAVGLAVYAIYEISAVVVRLAWRPPDRGFPDEEEGPGAGGA